ncbi:ABC transporter permease [Mycoplasma parvum]|uniref:Uncharacterized protein n=1 Tax=Mycoplasma parvum str. Indiana TaxID=1403316 RepID=U5NF83_9MOLU|nr:ABC transporter permease [Mycoplasma parvum]AGX88858.1 hypothetical protein PRV_00415 [Mycoplasma parvum str. Indiana]
MFLLSKTVINHIKTNFFSTAVITFFAGCSAFVQISTDNIKEIIDSSIKPYSIAPKNDMFIKTGSPDIYSGGSSFTVPVSVTIQDEKIEAGGPKEIEIRYLTPQGWFVNYKDQLASERMGKLKDSKANYAGDYCVPMKGIKSIYTNYWFRPKIRFKGIWDAALVKDGNLSTASLIPRDNLKFRKECADYTEEMDISNEFLGRMIQDYLKAYHSEENTDYKDSLVIAIAGADSKAQEKNKEKGYETVKINSAWGVFDEIPQITEVKSRERRDTISLSRSKRNATNTQQEEKAFESKKSSSDDLKRQDLDVDESLIHGHLTWEKLGYLCEFGDIKIYQKLKPLSRAVPQGQTNKCWKKVEQTNKRQLHTILRNGDMVGMSKDSGKVIEQIDSGKKYQELKSREFTRKYRERKKAKLKIQTEEWLLNSQYLDLRKILEEFRRKEGQTELVQASSKEDIQQTNDSTYTFNNHQLWTPFEQNPWLEKAKDRKIKRKAKDLSNIVNQWRLLQDNQMMKFIPDPREEYKLKFNIHRSIQLTNLGNSTASLKNRETTGHSFKVVSIEDIKERGELNPLVIVEGNPLFEAREDQEKLLRDFINVYDQPFYSPWMVPMLRMISRAKFTDEQKDIRNTFQWWVAYLQYPWRDTWNIPELLDKEYQPEYHRKLQIWLNEIQENNWNVSGSRIIFNFTSYQKFHLVDAQILPNLFVELKNFKMVGYIDQPTSYFTVISPEYARINGFKPISNEKYKEFRKIINNLWLEQETWEKRYKEFIDDQKNYEHIINVGDKKLIITGLGLTPELLYPAQSWISLQPDKTKEGVIYVDKFGFNDLKERGSTKWQEQYITVGFPEVIKAQSKTEQIKYMEKLQKYLDQKLDKHKDYYTLTKLGEEKGNDQLYSLRSSYIPAFQSRVGAVSYTLSGLIYAIVITLIIILVKRYIKSNMYLFSNFVANGMGKTDVLLNVCLFTLIPLAAATMIGYFLSLLTQSSFYSIISAYWFLNTKFNSLNLGNTLYFIFKVLSLVAPVAYFCSFWILKDNASALLKTTSGMKISKFNFFVYRLLYKISSIWKFRSVLLFNTLNQSAILSATSVIGFIFLNFFFHNHGKFSQVAKAEEATKKYGFDFELDTPTKESGEYNLSSYENLGKEIDLMQVENQQPTTNNFENKTFGVTKESDNTHYQIKGKYRETEILKDIYDNYYGQVNGWWGKSDLVKCDNHGAVTQQTESNGKQGDHACLKDYGAFLKTDNKWKLYPKSDNSRKKRETTTSSTNTDLKTYTHFETGEPIFKYWNDFYEKNIKKTNGNSSSSESSGWQTFTVNGNGQQQKTYHLPTLKTLLNWYKNFWIISSKDYDIIESSLEFFRGKTILRILLDINIEYNSESGKLNYNVWDWTSKNLEKVQPILKKLDEENYDNFIQDIVKSKYGPFFVSKFMTKHEATSSSQTEQGKINYKDLINKQGDKYRGKKTYFFKGEEIGRESQATNKRQKQRNGKNNIFPTQDLLNKSENGSNSTTDQQNSNNKAFEDGLYYLDGSKIIILNNSTIVDREIVIMYNPEFLYLLFTAIADFADQRNNGQSGEKYNLPIKYTFGNVVHTIENKEEIKNNLPPLHFFSSINGRSEYLKKASQNEGQQQTFDATKTPQGDQTYTWTKGTMTAKDKNKILSTSTKIIGLKEDVRGAYFKLFKDQKIINHLLYKKQNRNNNIFPIIVNRFAAKKHNLRVGDEIKFKPHNHYTRFTCQLKTLPKDEQEKNQINSERNGKNNKICELIENNSNLQLSSKEPKEYESKYHWKNKEIKEYTLKVIDIFDSYFKEAFFMSQKDVNKIIGLNEHTGFNGIFTAGNKTLDIGNLPEQISLAFSSYSVSGIYTNVQQKLENTAFRNLMSYAPPLKSSKQKGKEKDPKWIVGSDRNYKIYQELVENNNIDYTKVNDLKNQNMEQVEEKDLLQSTAQEDSQIEDEARNYLANYFLQAFSKYATPMNSSIIGVMNNNVLNDVIFKNLSNLTDNISYLFIFLVFPLLVVSLITVIYLLIKDLEGIFVTTKLLGFGNRENSMPITIYLFALLFISSFGGSCAVPSILNKYVNMLFNNQSILLPLSLNNGLMTGVFALLAVIYFFSMFKSYLKIKGICLPVSIKLLVG